MCTLVLLHRVVAGFPVVLGMNRDEFLDRPSEPPAVRAARLPFLAPRDLRAGGTWLGTNAAGLTVALANRGEEAAPEGHPSRGALVTEALGFGSAQAARAALEEKAGRAPTAPFRMLLADLEDACLVEGPDPWRVHRLEPGLCLLTHLHPPGEPKADELERLAADAPRLPLLEVVARLRAFLARTDAVTGDGFAPCRRLPDRGTRSSSLIARGRPLSRGLFLHAEGPPDTTRYEDLSALLREIAR